MLIIDSAVDEHAAGIVGHAHIARIGAAILDGIFMRNAGELQHAGPRLRRQRRDSRQIRDPLVDPAPMGADESFHGHCRSAWRHDHFDTVFELGRDVCDDFGDVAIA